jgi:ankyrin repeat protein
LSYILLRSYFDPKDLLKPNNFGETIVHIAASYGHLPFLRQLLQYADKACLHKRDSLLKTALHHACTSGNPVLISWLVREQGLSLAAVDKDNNTPAHLLAQQVQQNPLFGKVLVDIAQEFGTDFLTEPSNGDGKTPMDYLRAANQPEHLEELNRVRASKPKVP